MALVHAPKSGAPSSSLPIDHLFANSQVLDMRPRVNTRRDLWISRPLPYLHADLLTL